MSHKEISESATLEGHPQSSTEPKSKNQLKNDKKREEKMAKFLAKQEKMKEATITSAETSKPKTLNITVEAFEDKTVPGEKKGNHAETCLRYIFIYN